MSTAAIYVLAGIGIFGIGLYGLLSTVHLLRSLLSINVMSSGIFLLLVAPPTRAGEAPDPIAQALVLTGIVVSVAATAFGLALLGRLHAASGSPELNDRYDDDDDADDS